jgi:serine phosphatase RsbU (regulator of sigma subunit)
MDEADNQQVYDPASLEQIRSELENFQTIARHVLPTPGDTPDVPGVDIYGKSLQLGGAIGGDHIVFVDFNKRYDMPARIAAARSQGREQVARNLEQMQLRAGVLLADVSGHHITDALLAAMLHQAFLIGVQYELKLNGEVTKDLFENINTRFYNSSSQFKFITMIYGEIAANGTFRFLSAAHPPPIVFSNKFERIVPIGAEKLTHFPPIGSLASKNNWESAYRSRREVRYKPDYAISEISLMGGGDILLLYSDGLSEHSRDDNEYFFPDLLERELVRVKNLSAREIFEHLHRAMADFAPLQDDTSLVVIRKR